MAATSEARLRSLTGLTLAPLAFAVTWIAPLPLEPKAHRLAAVFFAVVIAWVTECIPVAATALLIAPLLVVTGVTDAKTAFAPYADDLLYLFVGGFFIAEAMSRHGLDRRIAHALVTRPFIAARPTRARAALYWTAVVVSMWISNTAATAILLPIVLGTMRTRAAENPLPEDHPEAKSEAGHLLGLAYAASIGGLGTLVGTPPNAIVAGLLRREGHAIGFLEWMTLGVPVALAMGLATQVFLAWHLPAVAETGPEVPAQYGPADAPPASPRALRATALAFGLAVLGWVLPDLLVVFGVPGAAAIAKALPGPVVALLAASVLFIARDETGEIVLPWRSATRIDWGVILLFGGGISLGTQLSATGLADTLARAVVGATGVTSVLGLTLLLVAFTIVLTEVCSNTAACNMVVPLAIAAARELGVSPVGPAVGVAMAASCGFMLPMATGPNAIVFGTGRVSFRRMLKVGLAADAICALVLLVTLMLLASRFALK